MISLVDQLIGNLNKHTSNYVSGILPYDLRLDKKKKNRSRKIERKNTGH